MRVKKPYVVIGLIAVNIIVFLIMEILGDTNDSLFMLKHGASFPVNITEGQEYWRFITSNYLHFGFDHIINNMVMLGCAGVILEEALGHVKFFILYTLSGIAGSALSYYEMMRSGEYAVSAGASGAIFGIIGALLWVVIINRGRYKSLTRRGMIFMIALSLYYGITQSGVDNWGHVGGLVFGFVMSIFLYRKERASY